MCCNNTGNSLGLQPKHLSDRLQVQLTKWAMQGVEAHFEEPTPWLSIDDIVVESSARLVGAKPSEVAIMNSLSANLHFMMASFYRPTAERFKIITEKKAFPSDTHAVVAQLLHHGLTAADALIEVAPREGELTLRDEDILEVHRL
jgi:kynureninase